LRRRNLIFAVGCHAFAVQGNSENLSVGIIHY
jgi:hypothetical protein